MTVTAKVTLPESPAGRLAMGKVQVVVAGEPSAQVQPDEDAPRLKVVLVGTVSVMSTLAAGPLPTLA